MARASMSEVDTQLIVCVRLGFLNDCAYEERRPRDVAENPLQNYLTTKVTKKWRKEHKERAINE